MIAAVQKLFKRHEVRRRRLAREIDEAFSRLLKFKVSSCFCQWGLPAPPQSSVRFPWANVPSQPRVVVMPKTEIEIRIAAK